MAGVLVFVSMVTGILLGRGDPESVVVVELGLDKIAISRVRNWKLVDNSTVNNATSSTTFDTEVLPKESRRATTRPFTEETVMTS